METIHTDLLRHLTGEPVPMNYDPDYVRELVVTGNLPIGEEEYRDLDDAWLTEIADRCAATVT